MKSSIHHIGYLNNALNLNSGWKRLVSVNIGHFEKVVLLGIAQIKIKIYYLYAMFVDS